MQVNRNIIIVIAAFLLSSLCACADDETYGKVHYNIPTPNASEHMRFGNIPVNYHTGSPSISIPLYNFDCEGVKLDISMQYDPLGLPMNRLPGYLNSRLVDMIMKSKVETIEVNK